MNYLKLYPELEPVTRSERFQFAIIEQLLSLNEKLEKLVKPEVLIVKSNQVEEVKVPEKKTRKKVEVVK